MATIEAVISDFGGVLTTPLADSFKVFDQTYGISPADLGSAIAAATDVLHANPLFELETGRLSEADFLGLLASALTRQLGRPVTLEDFSERYFGALEPNQSMIDYMRDLRRRGYRLALCTNNVREWEPLWRRMLPVDELFELVVDSAFVGTRKPEPRIYELTLERLGLEPAQTLLIDDIEVNCDAARTLGIRAVWFQSTEQVIVELDEILSGQPATADDEQGAR